MRTRYRYDPDLECLVEIGGNSNFFEEEKSRGPSVIGDTMGSNVNGLRAMYRKDKKRFDSKSRYRADVKAHGLQEVGNEANFQSKTPDPPKDFYGQQVQTAWQKYDGNHNGMADRVRQEERITQWRRNNG